MTCPAWLSTAGSVAKAPFDTSTRSRMLQNSTDSTRYAVGDPTTPPPPPPPTPTPGAEGEGEGGGGGARMHALLPGLGGRRVSRAASTGWGVALRRLEGLGSATALPSPPSASHSRRSCTSLLCSCYTHTRTHTHTHTHTQREREREEERRRGGRGGGEMLLAERFGAGMALAPVSRTHALHALHAMLARSFVRLSYAPLFVPACVRGGGSDERGGG